MIKKHIFTLFVMVFGLLVPCSMMMAMEEVEEKKLSKDDIHYFIFNKIIENKNFTYDGKTGNSKKVPQILIQEILKLDTDDDKSYVITKIIDLITYDHENTIIDSLKQNYKDKIHCLFDTLKWLYKKDKSIITLPIKETENCANERVLHYLLILYPQFIKSLKPIVGDQAHKFVKQCLKTFQKDYASIRIINKKAHNKEYNLEELVNYLNIKELIDVLEEKSENLEDDLESEDENIIEIEKKSKNKKKKQLTADEMINTIKSQITVINENAKNKKTHGPIDHGTQQEILHNKDLAKEITENMKQEEAGEVIAWLIQEIYNSSDDQEIEDYIDILDAIYSLKPNLRVHYFKKDDPDFNYPLHDATYSKMHITHLLLITHYANYNYDKKNNNYHSNKKRATFVKDCLNKVLENSEDSKYCITRNDKNGESHIEFSEFLYGFSDIRYFLESEISPENKNNIIKNDFFDNVDEEIDENINKTDKKYQSLPRIFAPPFVISTLISTITKFTNSGWKTKALLHCVGLCGAYKLNEGHFDTHKIADNTRLHIGDKKQLALSTFVVYSLGVFMPQASHYLYTKIKNRYGVKL